MDSCICHQLTMMRDSNPNAFTKKVHFANGFPPKDLVQASSAYTALPYNTGGHIVSLDEVSPRVGRAHHSIPPLAKRRGQFCSVKDRPGDERYKSRPDPFKLPKAAEKTGFSGSQIKHAKPRMVRMCHSTEPPSTPPATAAMYDVKKIARRVVYSTPPYRSLDSDLEDEVSPPSHKFGELKSNNIRIISDVEKESIQAELAGIEEVYQRVCHGKIESLYSLLYPSRKDTKRGPVQYINTSTPVQLRPPKIIQHIKKPAGKDEDSVTMQTGSSYVEKTKQDKSNAPVAPASARDDAKQKDNTLPILIPLPYIRSEISVITSGKHQKPMYNVPYIYSDKTDKGNLQHSLKHSNASPAVITFNPMNIPEICRPGTQKGLPVGSKINVLNKTNQGTIAGDARMLSTFPAPFISSTGPFQSATPFQTPAMFDDSTLEEKLNKLDIESVGSGTDCPSTKVSSKGSFVRREMVAGNYASNQGEETAYLEARKENSVKHSGVDMAKGIWCSLITDGGLVESVEIYDYNKRDVESEQEAAKQIQELESLGEKKLKEFTNLLEEHQHILDEVKQLERELNKTHQ